MALAVTTTTLALPHGIPSSALLGASGNTGQVRWSISSGRLPDGLQFVPPGAFAGVASAPGSCSVTVRAEDMSTTGTPVGFVEAEVTINVT